MTRCVCCRWRSAAGVLPWLAAVSWRCRATSHAAFQSCINTQPFQRPLLPSNPAQHYSLVVATLAVPVALTSAATTAAAAATGTVTTTTIAAATACSKSQQT